jgi:MYXO-CTERM domain-containing protein
VVAKAQASALGCALGGSGSGGALLLLGLAALVGRLRRR